MVTDIVQNGLQYIDIVDSAVKIGLGAFIGIIGTWVSIRLNHKNDIASKKLDKKMAMLEESIQIIDNYLSHITSLTKEWNKYELKPTYLKDLINEEQEKYIAIDDAFILSKDESAKAAMYLRILGCDNILVTIQTIDSIVHPIRASIRLNHDTFVMQPELKTVYRNVNALTKVFHKETKEAFDNLE